MWRHRREGSLLVSVSASLILFLSVPVFCVQLSTYFVILRETRGGSSLVKVWVQNRYKGVTFDVTRGSCPVASVCVCLSDSVCLSLSLSVSMIFFSLTLSDFFRL